LQLQEEEFAYPEGFTTLEKTTTKNLNLFDLFSSYMKIPFGGVIVLAVCLYDFVLFCD